MVGAGGKTAAEDQLSFVLLGAVDDLVGDQDSFRRSRGGVQSVQPIERRIGRRARIQVILVEIHVDLVRRLVEGADRYQGEACRAGVDRGLAAAYREHGVRLTDRQQVDVEFGLDGRLHVGGRGSGRSAGREADLDVVRVEAARVRVDIEFEGDRLEAVADGKGLAVGGRRQVGRGEGETVAVDRLRHDRHHLGAQIQLKVDVLVCAVVEDGRRVSHLLRHVLQRVGAGSLDRDRVAVVGQRFGKTHNDPIGLVAGQHLVFDRVPAGAGDLNRVERAGVEHLPLVELEEQFARRHVQGIAVLELPAGVGDDLHQFRTNHSLLVGDQKREGLRGDPAGGADVDGVNARIGQVDLDLLHVVDVVQLRAHGRRVGTGRIEGPGIVSGAAGIGDPEVQIVDQGGG